MNVLVSFPEASALAGSSRSLPRGRYTCVGDVQQCKRCV